MKLVQCFHIQMVVVPFLRINPSAVVFSAIYIYFPPKKSGENIRSASALTSVGKPPCFYTFYLVYKWHCRIKLFLRHLPNCPCSNFSRYVEEKTNDYENFEKGMIYIKTKDSREKGGGGNEIHVQCACGRGVLHTTLYGKVCQ
jgi:hypothetical protein